MDLTFRLNQLQYARNAAIIQMIFNIETLGSYEPLTREAYLALVSALGGGDAREA